ETAHVQYGSAVAVIDLVATVEATGYSATVPSPAPTADESSVHRAEATALARLITAGVLTAPILAPAMGPAWEFRCWQWVVLALVTPVATWWAWPFHRAALVNLRHGSATMDTLISLGAIVSYTWSLWALVFGEAGTLGMRMRPTWLAGTADATSHLYFEVGAALVTFQLLGPYIQPPPHRQAPP